MYLLALCISIIATSCQPEASSPEADPSQATAPHIVVVGGGSSHDFDRWFNEEDTQVYAQNTWRATYTDVPSDLNTLLPGADILSLTNNQPIPDSLVREMIFDHVAKGKGLLLVHPSTWYNWADWPAYNRELVGGGARSHGPYGPFEVRVVDTDHPIMEGVPETFMVEDELYRFEPVGDASPINVLAIGTEPDTGTEYPVVWTAAGDSKRIVGITLGHDAPTHQSPEYKSILANSARWLLR